MRLSPDELDRYGRQMLLDGWGEEGQRRLKGSTVFIAGAGGLGSPAAIYLAVAGIGRLRICDMDTLEQTNLNRQILHDDTRVGVNKSVSARQTLALVNPHVKVTVLTDTINEENVTRLVGGADIIVDCLDNFVTRYLLNEAAARLGIPLVYGSVWGLEGRLSFFRPPETPCLRCLFPEGPPKGVFPVVGVTPGVIGTLEAMEALKFLTGVGQNLTGKLLVWDGGAMTFRTFPIAKDPHCPVCSAGNPRHG
ncbi:MAG TPA: HesA/MoeB/ThiF family protein [Verrucomicrobiae bacterium]|nr:HesA/MoeB/ThiF family protein [Verrucomicrobiae bacterium]